MDLIVLEQQLAKQEAHFLNMQNSLSSSMETKNKERKYKFLFIFSTRPEAINLAPLMMKRGKSLR